MGAKSLQLGLLLFSVLLHCHALLRISHSIYFETARFATVAEKVIPDVATEGAQFNWEEQWYPIAVEAFTDKRKPNKFMLLGNDVVLWHDKKTWRVFDDTCPHRGVPLSEGRVEKNGTLLCAYHAWQFDGDGKCVSIPQSRTPEKEAVLKASPKACVHSHPTQVAQGLIWCWGQKGLPGSDVGLQAALKSPLLIEELSDPQYQGRITPYIWNQRDLPYGWDFFMENTLDPAHVSVSHHGIAGNRYKNAVYLNFTRVPSRTEVPITEGGLYNSAYPGDVGFNHLIQTAEESQHFSSQSFNDFRPPCFNKIERLNPDGSKLILALYATPTKPGYCRHLGVQVLIKGENNQVPAGLGSFGRPKPVWLLHLMASLFLHQDQVFLHHQERKLLHAAPRSYAFGRFLSPARDGGGEGSGGDHGNAAASGNSSGGRGASAPVAAAAPGFEGLHNDYKTYAAAHFTPNEHDIGITKLRRWISRRAQGGPAWGSAALALGLPPTLPSEQLFDVYHAHVEGCTVCQAALKNTRRVRAMSIAALLSSLVFAKGPVVRIAGAVASSATALAAHKLIGLFYHFPYSHQDND